MEQLKNIKHSLVSLVQTQLGDLKKTDAKELGEVVDMIKDLEEAMYYCSIIEAMEKSQEKNDTQPQNNIAYFMEPERYYGDRMMYRGDNNGSNNSSSSSNSSNSRNYTPYMEYAPYMMRDENWRNSKLDGRSNYSRRMYMEKKNTNGNNTDSMQELEHYIQDLGDDLTDMVKSSNPEEKQVLSTKLQQLATKINNTK